MKSNFKKLLFLRKLNLHQPPGYLQESALTVPVATHDVGLLLATLCRLRHLGYNLSNDSY